MDKPYYPHQAIASIEVLAKTLGIHPGMLERISNNVDNSYTEFVVPSKNKERTVYEPKYELKKLQKRINKRIFENVDYPLYLHGGIKDPINKRDYVENAKAHSINKTKTLISLDIKSFYDNIASDKVFAIYKYLFKFPDNVCNLLTTLTTFKNKVPQGACTSSYIANLVFFNSEYSLVSGFRNKGITYTRLLDDVTLSSENILPQIIIDQSVKRVIGLFKKHDLKQNDGKTKVELYRHSSGGFEVTGLWIGKNKPQARRSNRRYIRLMVYICEREYEKSPYTEEYHTIWNKVSGLVAKLHRLDQSNHKALRERLQKILPLYDDRAKAKIIHDCKSLLRLDNSKQYSFGQIERINKNYSRLSILSRNNNGLSTSWRRRLKKHFANLPSKKEFWT
ncbi:reverse transcriptase family protein [Sodalis sp. RH15]|uniref:reverse transcriptase family protein n=1 Tax=Sodalis sp. RH15 TaxID=3394330 RepID=UPI0039B48361